MTLVVAAAVVVREGRVLLTQRPRGTHLEGRWEFPGGKLEAEEDPKHAVVRECREECDIEVEVGDILDVTFHAYPGRSVLLLFYRCRLMRGEVRHLGVADHVWVRPEELEGYDLPPADAPVVAKVRALLGGN